MPNLRGVETLMMPGQSFGSDRPESKGDVSVARLTRPTSNQIAGAVKLYVAVPARADLGRVPKSFGAQNGWASESQSAG